MSRRFSATLLLRRAAQFGLALLLLLALAELALRQMERRGLAQLDAPGPDARRLFTAVGDRYLPTNPVDFSESEFAAVKPPGVWRMFILGDSFAQSFPYQYDCSMADWIARELSLRQAGRSFEVINAAGGTAGSDRVLQILDEVSDYQPDLVLVVLGNNEISSQSGSLDAGFLRRLAVVRGLRRLAPRLFRTAPRFEMGQPELYEHFRANLRTMGDRAHARGFELAFGTLPVNLPRRSVGLLFQRDAISQVLQEIKPQDALDLNEPQRRALQSYWAGDFSSVAGPIANLLDSRSVYIKAAADERLGRVESASHGYVQALPDIGHLLALNRIVNEEAERDRTPLLDLDSAVRRMSMSGLAGRDVFLDDCHLRWFAYAALSRLIAQELVARGLTGNAEGAEPNRLDAARADNLCPLPLYLPQAAKQAAGYVVLSIERPLINALPKQLLR